MNCFSTYHPLQGKRQTISLSMLMVLLTMPTASCAALAQTAAAKPWQAELNAGTAQMRLLEDKMPWTKQAPAARATPDQGPAVSRPLPSLSDSKLHLGGVTITPGGFLELDGIARRGP